MHEILARLSPDQLVLDLGCARGSFSKDCTRATVVRVDRERPSAATDGLFVCADAGVLPIADQSLDVVIANHSLEHFENLDRCLAEIGRVLRPGGSLFVSVPDASTISDRLYRWLGRGGGHVNPFTSPDALVQRIESATRLKLAGMTTLMSSLSFLNRANFHARPPRRIMLVGGGTEVALLFWTWISRRLDHLFGSRLSVYGWAFYFGWLPSRPSCSPLLNVCIRCGSGFTEGELKESGVRRNLLGIPMYACPMCRSRNVYSRASATSRQKPQAV